MIPIGGISTDRPTSVLGLGLSQACSLFYHMTVILHMCLTASRFKSYSQPA